MKWNILQLTSYTKSKSMGYVTLIIDLVESLPPQSGGSFFTHCPVSWFTLRGLFISWGFVPTGLRGGCWCRTGGGAGGSLHSNDSCGVRGLCSMYGLAALTEGLATLVEGLGKIIPPGLVRLLKPDKAPGLDIDWLKLSPSSSGGVWASPTLPQLPRLSSDWFPSLPSPDSK